MELIAAGTPVFKGHRRAIVHASEEHYNLYATCEGVNTVGNDRGSPPYGPFLAWTMNLQGPDEARYPWETLEQPSMGFYIGSLPGTITLNHWTALSGNPGPAIELRDPGVQARNVGLKIVLERLIYLESGFEEDYEDLMYKNLYTNLLRDPEKYLKPHKTMEKQITDLIMVLSRKDWIDFSKPENQVVAKFFTNATYTEDGYYKQFFHQLLLSMELYLRIHSKQHGAEPKEKLLAQLPPCIAWDLALARKWRECMTIEKFNTAGSSSQIRFHLEAKKGQVKALRKFARAMKWPNLAKVDDVLKERDPENKPLEDRSSDTMSYFTGMILPGITLPWLIMNSLIDCDQDASKNNDLATLSHMYPASGFQYRSTTYWSAACIVGKVLAPTCRSIGGWVGPARPAPDIARNEIARIRQRRPKQGLAVQDVQSMIERSDPLGPPAERYPVSDYQFLEPELDAYFFVNTVRVEKLALKPVSVASAPGNVSEDKKPLIYDAAVQFAIAGESWPLRLSYDVSFVAACPCSQGPHPLFFDYIFKAVRVDEILTIRDWGSLNGGVSSAGSAPTSSVGAKDGRSQKELNDTDIDNETEKVLVIEAFGVPDNEVLARAWCSHWGLCAVVADVRRTCMACAIREAYAACLNVVILVEEQVLHDDE